WIHPGMREERGGCEPEAIRRDRQPGEPATHHYKRAVCLACRSIRCYGSELELAEVSLTQVQSLGQRPEAVRALVYPRDAERSCHRPGVQPQALPPQPLLPTICASHATRVLCGIDGRHGAGEHSRGAQRCRER